MISKPRSTRPGHVTPKWTRVEPPAGFIPGLNHAFRSQTGLAVLISIEPTGPHLSISHPDRYPTWDEIADAKYTLLPGVTMSMILPGNPAEYVNLHDTTFHLYGA